MAVSGGGEGRRGVGVRLALISMCLALLGGWALKRTPALVACATRRAAPDQQNKARSSRCVSSIIVFKRPHELNQQAEWLEGKLPHVPEAFFKFIGASFQ